MMGRGGIPEKEALEVLGWGMEKHFRQREHTEWPRRRMEYGTFKSCPQIKTVGLGQNETRGSQEPDRRHCV